MLNAHNERLMIPTPEVTGDTIVQIARQYIGSPTHSYTSATEGMDPQEGFDCSGFVVYVLQQAGIILPEYVDADGMSRPIRHAREMFDYLPNKPTEEDKQPGDLVIFSLYNRGGWMPSHIGFVVENDEMIHASAITKKPVDIVPIYRGSIPPDYAKLKGCEQKYFENPIGYRRII